MKIILNTCFGGFHLNKKAKAVASAHPSFLFSKKDIDNDDAGFPIYSKDDINLRTNPELIKFLEQNPKELKPNDFAQLEIVEVPNDVHFMIDEYDGTESIITSKSPMLNSDGDCVSLPSKENMIQKTR